MARLNTHPSATPQPTRASTTDSLYRDPSVAPRNAANTRTSSYSVMSPTASVSSDKENEQPETRENTPQPPKRRGLHGASARMPTPTSGSTTGGSNGKRRRTGEYSMSGSGGPIYQDEPEDAPEEEEDGDDEDVDKAGTPVPTPEDEEGDLKFYNPNQDPEVRRRLRATIRDHTRMVDENRDEMVKPNTMLLDALKKQDNLFGKVRQTADAALDSRFLVNASELAGKKLNISLQGNAGAGGIDLDQFVSKCIYFMKSGGRIGGDDDDVALPVPEDDDEDAGDDGLDWGILGRKACFPCNKRPPTASFLLGPLSVQKKVRAPVQRKAGARSQRQPVGPATRPQEIKEGDIQQSDNANLSNLVKSINTHLRKHIEQVDDKVTKELEDSGDVDAEDIAAASRRHRAAVTSTQELAVSLLDFAINPHDFGQTVENLFYISFLVREGNAKILKDEDGLPLLMPSKAHEISEQRENSVQKNQAVLSIDYSTWRMFIKAFDITEPLIPHREPEADIAPGGWYA